MIRVQRSSKSSVWARSGKQSEDEAPARLRSGSRGIDPQEDTERIVCKLLLCVVGSIDPQEDIESGALTIKRYDSDGDGLQRVRLRVEDITSERAHLWPCSITRPWGSWLVATKPIF